MDPKNRPDYFQGSVPIFNNHPTWLVTLVLTFWCMQCVDLRTWETDPHERLISQCALSSGVHLCFDLSNFLRKFSTSFSFDASYLLYNRDFSSLWCPSLPLYAIDKITYAYGQAKTYEELNSPFASFVCMCETWERCEERKSPYNQS